MSATTWVSEGDTFYIGARRVFPSDGYGPLRDTFFHLAREALERYLKAVLAANDPIEYNSERLKRIGHDLEQLLDTVKKLAPEVAADDELAMVCKVLHQDWRLTRYMAGQDVSTILEKVGGGTEHHDQLARIDLRTLDRIFRVLRNSAVRPLGDLAQDTVLALCLTSEFPFDEPRQAFTDANEEWAAGRFEALSIPS